MIGSSLIAEAKNNKLIFLPISEPVYQRGKSATQGIVNLANNERNAIEY